MRDLGSRTRHDRGSDSEAPAQSQRATAHSLLQTYGALTAQQMRLSRALGWDRHAKAVNEPHDLQTYLASKANGQHRNGRAHAVTIDAEEVD